jgi:hypothetical protein
MPNKLCIVLSGRKQAGKNTACNYILAKFYNHQSLTRSQEPTWDVDQQTGELRFNGKALTHSSDLPNDDAKIYSFADPLKRFCIDVLGAPEEACYGTDQQKNTPIEHLRWENVPLGIRPGIGDPLDCNRGAYSVAVYPEYKVGPMTGREIMQFFGTDICRRLYGDCWAAGTYNSIRREGFTLALVCDGRFPNEITMGNTVKAKTIRLGRNVYNDQHASETALDNFPISDYSLYIDNQNMTIAEQLGVVEEHVEAWFKEAGIYDHQ